MYASTFYCDQVYDGYQTLKDGPLVDGFHINLKNCGNGNIGGSSKLDP